jgi:hypothetical protein
MEPQPDINELVSIYFKKDVSHPEIIEILSGIIKQQIMYGGTLEDKINYFLHNARKL